MTIEIRSLTLPSSLPLSILITNHDRLPEAVSVEFSNYLPADPKSAQRIAGMATASACSSGTAGPPDWSLPTGNTLVSTGVPQTVSTVRSGA